MNSATKIIITLVSVFETLQNTTIQINIKLWIVAETNNDDTMTR